MYFNNKNGQVGKNDFFIIFINGMQLSLKRVCWPVRQLEVSKLLMVTV